MSQDFGGELLGDDPGYAGTDAPYNVPIDVYPHSSGNGRVRRKVRHGVGANDPVGVHSSARRFSPACDIIRRMARSIFQWSWTGAICDEFLIPETGL